MALPHGQSLHNLQVGDGSGQTSVALDGNLALSGSLLVQPGATLDLATYTLTVEGAVANYGSLRQARSVTSGVARASCTSPTAPAASDKYWGVDIAPAASMGSTLVSRARPPGLRARAASRCSAAIDITPTTASVSDITFYYQADEANGADRPASYHWNGTVWEGPLTGTASGSGDAMYVTAMGVSAYSPFALRNYAPLAVTLEGFAAQAQPGHVLLTWQTASELDNLGFTVLRSQSPQVEPEPLAFVPSQGPGSAQGFSYAWQDEKVEPGVIYWYWLEDVDLAGVGRATGRSASSTRCARRDAQRCSHGQ